jgi:hypothetical protein
MFSVKSGELLRGVKMKNVKFPLLTWLIIIGIVLFFCGCVVVNITEDLQNPYLITMTWNGETLVPDPETGELPVQTLDENGVEVKALVTDENGKIVVPDIYEWYLKGELFEEGEDTVFLNGTLEIGTYWLDLIVGEDEILSSEQVEFVKEK